MGKARLGRDPLGGLAGLISVPDSPPAGAAAETASQQDSLTVKQPDSKPAKQLTSKTVSQHNSKLSRQQASKTAKQQAVQTAGRLNSKPASQQNRQARRKATFYLREELIKPLKMLKVECECDLSDLVCEAIEDLLQKYKRS